MVSQGGASRARDTTLLSSIDEALDSLYRGYHMLSDCGRSAEEVNKKTNYL